MISGSSIQSTSNLSVMFYVFKKYLEQVWKKAKIRYSLVVRMLGGCSLHYSQCFI